MVFLTSELNEKKALEFEERVFGDDRVGLASRFFNCVRISLDDVPSAKIRKQYGAARGPSIVFLDAEGKELKAYRGWRTSGAGVYSAMSSVLRATRKMKLAALLRKENQFLKRLDDLYWKIEDAKFDLGELSKRKGKSAQRQVAKLRGEIAKLEKSYEDLQKEEDAFLRRADAVASDN